MRRNRFTRVRHKVLCDINLTNLIDVTMTVLVCYMIITPMLEQGIDVKLPQTSPHRLVKTDQITITITKDNKIYLGNSLVTLSQLKKSLKKEQGVIIKADNDVNYGNVIKVLDELNASGISNVGLATEIKE